MDKELLVRSATAMVANGKGLVAADESTSTIKKRFDPLGVEDTEENRRLYRQIICTTEGIEDYVGGVILFDETIRQKDDGGKPFVATLTERGIVPGIKVDMGAKPMALHDGETVTEGLDGLRERLNEYFELGARFAKWRAVITIKGDALPTEACIDANAHALARYAALCQEVGIVPVVEPEVLLDGDHDIQKSFEVTMETQKEMFEEMEEMGIYMEGVIIKPSMVISGKNNANRADTQEVAEMTLECLHKTVPENLAGVVFLSGGQGDEEATAHLDAMNKIGNNPWPVSFSYSRAILSPVIKLWADGDTEGAKKAYLHRVKANSLAAKGEWSKDFEKDRPY